MNLKLEDIVPDSQKPFAKCKLGRKQCAPVLKSIIQACPAGFVISVDGQWGSGKTTFMKMWKAYLENDGYKTIYYNAWESDYMEDPLLSLIAEIRNVDKNKEAKDQMKDIVSNVSKIAWATAPSLTQAVLKKYVGIDSGDLIGAAKAAIDKTTSIITKKIDEYDEQRSSFEAFKESLSKYVEIVSKDKSLIFIVDELDRCNPHYAVKVLERIKHLFSIPKIVFVLAIDKEQLGNSICGYYGSDRINSQEYLRKFIDIDYKLPDPDALLFCEYLYEYYDFKSIQDNFNDIKVTDEIKRVAQVIVNRNNLSLRQIDRIFCNLRLSCQLLINKGTKIPVIFMFILIYFKFCKLEIYDKIYHHVYSLQDFISVIEDNVPPELLSSDSDSFWTNTNKYILWDIIYMFRNYISNNIEDINKAYKDDNTNELNLSLKIIEPALFKERLNAIRCDSKYGIFGISYFLDKINLFDNINVN